MNETLLNLITTPAGLVAVLVFLHFRLKRVEEKLEALGTRVTVINGAKPQPVPVVPMTLSTLSMICLMLCASGCAVVNQKATDAQGKQTTSLAFALWPATGSIDKAGAKQTKTTQDLSLAGTALDGGGTNMVAALTELRRILEMIPK